MILGPPQYKSGDPWKGEIAVYLSFPPLIASLVGQQSSPESVYYGLSDSRESKGNRTWDHLQRDTIWGVADCWSSLVGLLFNLSFLLILLVDSD